MPNDTSGVDKDALNLTRAIALTESGTNGRPNYNASGKSGEHGAYQWMPGNYEAAAKEAGLNPSDFSPEAQDKVAYYQVKKYKDKGYQPWQIASLWNSGSPDNWKEHSGVNAQGVPYDTPKYVSNVKQNYVQLANGGTPGAPVPEQQGSFLGDVGKTISDIGSGVTSAITTPNINPISRVIQGTGAVAKGIGGITSNVLEHLPIVGGIVKGAENLVGKGVQKLAGTDYGQQVIKEYGQFSQEHPELAKNIESGVDIASAIPVLKGVGVVKNAVKGGIERGLVGATDATLEMVSPKLSPKETAKALAQRGTETKGILRSTTLKPDPQAVKIADVVKTNVPTFDPSKGAIYNIAETQKVVSQMAKDLKQKVITSGKDRIYPFQQLQARLKGLERPVLIASDKTLNNAYDKVIKKAMDIAKTKGGKVSDLLDTRQEFDNFVKQQFPHLYDSDTLTPMRQAVKDIRNTITDFTAENLPSEVGLKDSLLTQHQLINAIENMSEKAVVPGASDLNTNMISRFGNRHPVIKGLVKSGAKAAAEGTGIGAVLRMTGH